MRRIKLLSIFAICLSLVLISYIYNMQFRSYDKYLELAKNNKIITKPIPAQRGIIYDRNMDILAENKPSINVFITPKNCVDINAALDFIASYTKITPKIRKKFAYNLKHQHKFETIVVKEDLSPEEAALIYSNSPAMPCVSVHESLKRFYHMTPALTNVIGYISGTELDNKGVLGVEESFDNILEGSQGYYKYEVNAARQPVQIINEQLPEKGYDIKLTIDAKLQAFAYEAFGNETGAAVAINPKNGEILALVSHPNIDSNLFLHSISNKIYQEILNNPDRPMIDRTSKGQFAPGSTIKPFIAISALEAGYIPYNFYVDDNLGYFIPPKTKHKYRDWLRTNGGHGRVDIEQALAYSCDVFFYKLSMLVGMKKITPWLSGFGFGQNLVPEIPYAAKGVLSSPKWKQQHIRKPWYTGDTVMSYIGQGYMLTTPLQLATATSIMTNKGLLIQPHLLKSIVAKGFELKHKSHSEPRLELSNASLEKITHGMERVITEPYWNTGWRFGLPKYSVAAKTGTAQVVHDNRKTQQSEWQKQFRDNSWFIAFSPSHDPKMVLVILVEHSPNASKIARKIFDFAKTHQLI